MSPCNSGCGPARGGRRDRFGTSGSTSAKPLSVFRRPSHSWPLRAARRGVRLSSCRRGDRRRPAPSRSRHQRLRARSPSSIIRPRCRSLPPLRSRCGGPARNFPPRCGPAPARGRTPAVREKPLVEDLELLFRLHVVFMRPPCRLPLLRKRSSLPCPRPPPLRSHARRVHRADVKADHWPYPKYPATDSSTASTASTATRRLPQPRPAGRGGWLSGWLV